MLGRTEDASYVFEIVKTCRKFNLGLLLINQEVEGLLTSEAGKSVLANSAYTLLMRQKPAVIEQVQETFHLSKPERDYLLTAGIGEGIICHLLLRSFVFRTLSWSSQKYSRTAWIFCGIVQDLRLSGERHRDERCAGESIAFAEKCFARPALSVEPKAAGEISERRARRDLRRCR